MTVDRCICADVGFDRLGAILRERGGSLSDLRRWTNCCNGCGLCEPYVRLVIRTGRTSFAVLSEAEASAILAEPEPRRGAAGET